MRLNLISISVDDQRQALAFYTDVLGFVKHHDIPLGPHAWLTVVSPEQPDGPELLLEPADHPAKRAYRDALAEEGTPMLQLTVDDVRAEHDRLVSAGVTFIQPRPMPVPWWSRSSTTPAATSSSSRRRRPPPPSRKGPDPARPCADGRWSGGPPGDRTQNQRIKSPVLCQLS